MPLRHSPRGHQPELLSYRQRSEFDAIVDLHAARWLTQKDIDLAEVRFVHSRNENREEVERVLGCPVLYEQEKLETVFYRDDISLPLPTADNELLRVLMKNADQVLAERQEEDNDFVDAVTERIIDQLSTGEVTAKKVAMDLGTSQRTITRRLAEI